MSARHAKLLFLVLIVLVTLLFFLHVPNGSFQARNGPTTPVNNLRIALAGLFLLLVAGTTVVPSCRPRASILVGLLPALPCSSAARSGVTSLRC